MRKTLIVLFLILSNLVNAQEYKEVIKSEFTEYLDALVSRDFEKSIDYLTPEFFDIIPRSQMVLMMEKIFNDPSMEFELKNPEIIEIQDSQKIDDKYYSLLTYSNEMNIKFIPEEEETDDEKKMRISILTLSMEEAFGSENVVYDEKTEFFEIQSQKDVYAISKNGETEWKFLVIEKEQKLLLKKLLPEELTADL